MSISAQQLAAQKNISWVIAEKIAKKFSPANIRQRAFFLVKWNWANSLASAGRQYEKR